MRVFRCSCSPQSDLFFESTVCNACNRVAGYCDDRKEVVTFDPGPEPDLFVRVKKRAPIYRKCENNALHQACNGMILLDETLEPDQQPTLCFACHFNHTIPDLRIPQHLPLWRKLETAKRRTLFTLVSLKLDLPDRVQDPETGICFHFLADKDATDHFRSALPDQEQVFTGHDGGHITINLAEADDIVLASTKIAMGEHYRTLLGHFRHEIGHYFWDQLIEPHPKVLSAFREVFGDETQDYQAALKHHYEKGPPDHWQEHHISSYATMHPWEDWAETWAHYLHLIDTLQTAESYGVHLKGTKKPQKNSALNKLVPAQQTDYFHPKTSIDEILTIWMQYSVMLNALNRSMGLQDAYPFVLYPEIREKLKFVHRTVHGLH